MRVGECVPFDAHRIYGPSDLPLAPATTAVRILDTPVETQALAAQAHAHAHTPDVGVPTAPSAASVPSAPSVPASLHNVQDFLDKYSVSMSAVSGPSGGVSTAAPLPLPPSPQTELPTLPVALSTEELHGISKFHASPYSQPRSVASGSTVSGRSQAAPSPAPPPRMLLQVGRSISWGGQALTECACLEFVLSCDACACVRASVPAHA